MKFDLNLGIPEFAKAEPEAGIQDLCLQYSHNGLTGEFTLGTESLGQSLIIQPFQFRWDYGIRWGRKAQNWLDLAFVNQDSQTAVLSLKKQSAINVYSWLSQLRAKGIHLEALSIELLSKSVDVALLDDAGSYGDSYNAVDIGSFGFVPELKYTELVNFQEDQEFKYMLVGEV